MTVVIAWWYGEAVNANSTVAEVAAAHGGVDLVDNVKWVQTLVQTTSVRNLIAQIDNGWLAGMALTQLSQVIALCRQVLGRPAQSGRSRGPGG